MAPVGPWSSTRPIGIFDSGIGGLTVVRQVRKLRPEAPIVYIADQAHVPYGDRPLDEVAGFAEQLTAHLFDLGCKMVIMACNISSSVALEAMRAKYGEDRVLGVIDPGVKDALAATANDRIGVLATTGTVRSRAYTRSMHRLRPGITVVEEACPEFVPLVEASTTDGPSAAEAVKKRMAPLFRAGVDTLVLGCTHYPYLLPALLREIGDRSIHIIDPAVATARTALDMLSGSRPALRASQIDKAGIMFRRSDLESSGTTVDTVGATSPLVPRLFTTGDVEVFRSQVERVAPELTTDIAGRSWDDLHLTDREP